MNGKFRRLTAALISTVTLAVSGLVALPANAAGTLTTNVDLKQTSFSKKWKTTWDFDCGIGYKGSMTVGYDTFATNEDYVDDFGTLNGNHYAGVKNSSNKIEYTKTASAGISTGKADVVHVSSPITYYAFWAV